MMTHRRFTFFLYSFLPVLMFGGGCSSRPGPDPIPAETLGQNRETEAFSAVPDSLLAIVRSGEAPLWFEFRPGGPALISGPEEAAEEPFAPWPQTRYAAGFAVDEKGRLIMAVNRDGFLVWEDREDGLALYRIPGGEAWTSYTVAALFMYQETPSVLLYRDDFFPEDTSSGLTRLPVIPGIRVWGLGANYQGLAEMEIPAFSGLPPLEKWDLNVLALGSDGLWYYRGARKEASLPLEKSPEIRYFRTRDLSVPGESSSVGVFRNAMMPYNKAGIPLPIQAVLEEAGHKAGEGQTLAAAIVSPEFPIRRYFTLHMDFSGGQEILELAGFYFPPDMAAVVFPDGQGVLNGPADVPQTFGLPVLPGGFVYTRIGFAGPALIAAWEEQQDWQVGAAGFMVINSPYKIRL
jgi:hypothetical protein